MGGAVRGLLVTDPAAVPERPTDDVDLVVELTSLVDLTRFGDELRVRGFREDTTPGAPICRWVVDDVKVDVMPTEGSILGFRNRWYGDAMGHPLEAHVDGARIRIIDAPHFCATKLEAFSDRGGGDLYHHDLEDVIALVDGRAELHAELSAAADGVRRFVADGLRGLLGQDRFLDALPGHLAADAAGQARLPLVIRRLRSLAAL
ncbi:MAG: hypothetical protein ACRENE_30590 [Polyangiaceae bacterium]